MFQRLARVPGGALASCSVSAVARARPSSTWLPLPGERLRSLFSSLGLRWAAPFPSRCFLSWPQVWAEFTGRPGGSPSVALSSQGFPLHFLADVFVTTLSSILQPERLEVCSSLGCPGVVPSDGGWAPSVPSGFDSPPSWVEFSCLQVNF